MTRHVLLQFVKAVQSSFFFFFLAIISLEKRKLNFGVSLRLWDWTGIDFLRGRCVHGNIVGEVYRGVCILENRSVSFMDKFYRDKVLGMYLVSCGLVRVI